MFRSWPSRRVDTTLPQTERASTPLMLARAQIKDAQLDMAAATLQGYLDSLTENDEQDRVDAIILLARVYASQQKYDLAEKFLREVPLVEPVTSLLAEVLSAQAANFASEDKQATALKLTSEAHSLCPASTEVTSHIHDLLCILVPVLALSPTEDVQVQPDLLFVTLDLLLGRLKDEATNGQLLHTIALLGEHIANSAAGDMARGSNLQLAWEKAAACWVQLAHNQNWWRQWSAHIGQLRGQPPADVSDLPQQVIERLKRECEEFASQDSRMGTQSTGPDMGRERLLRLANEIDSADAIASIMERAAAQANALGFFGPVAGVNMLAYLGRISQLEMLLQRGNLLVIRPSLPADEIDTALQTLRECMSPLWQVYALRRMGRTDEAVTECRKTAHRDVLAKALLIELLVERGRALLEGDDASGAREVCLEALKLAPNNSDVQALAADVCRHDVYETLGRHSRKYDEAIVVARADLQRAPNAQPIKKVLAWVLVDKAMHLYDFHGESLPPTAACEALACVKEARNLDETEANDDLVVFAFRKVVGANLSDPDLSESQRLTAWEEVITQGERTIPNNTVWRDMRVGLLRSRAQMYLSDQANKAAIRSNPSWISTIAAYLEQAWRLDDSPDDDDRIFTALCISDLAELFLSENPKARTAGQYKAAHDLLTQALTWMPVTDVVLGVRAWLYRSQAFVLYEAAGGMEGNAVPEANRQTIMQLFNLSWQASHSDAEAEGLVAMAMASIGMEQYPAARRYATQALRSSDAEIRTRAASLLADADFEESYNKAVDHFNAASTLFNRKQYARALQSLRAASEQLRQTPTTTPHQIAAVQDLYGLVTENTNLLHQAGYR